MSLSFKTVRGEDYMNCDIMFGQQPITVSNKKLAKKINRAGVTKTVVEWLRDDPRLMSVEPDVSNSDQADADSKSADAESQDQADADSKSADPESQDQEEQPAKKGIFAKR